MNNLYPKRHEKVIPKEGTRTSHEARNKLLWFAVGIGTTSPGQKLHIYNGGFLVNNSGNASLFFVDNVTGNVGIGTTSPSGLLNVNGTGTLLNVSGGDVVFEI